MPPNAPKTSASTQTDSRGGRPHGTTVRLAPTEVDVASSSGRVYPMAAREDPVHLYKDPAAGQPGW